MKSIKRGLAVFLAALLIMPDLPVAAEETSPPKAVVADEVLYNTGNHTFRVVVPGSEVEAVPETATDGASEMEEAVTEVETDGDSGTEAESASEMEEAATEVETDGDSVTAADSASEMEEAVTEVETGDDSVTEAEPVSRNEEDVVIDDNDMTVSGSESGEFVNDEEEQPLVDEPELETSVDVAENIETEVNAEEQENIENVNPENNSVAARIGDAYFEADGSYTINIPEANPFFPYEVQFTCNGEVTRKWFMTPNDSVEVGGHVFYVSAYFDNTVVTQMSLNVAGDTVVVYPEAKEFTEDGNGTQPLSLLPLKERNLTVDLTAYTPAELTMVSIDTIFAGADNEVKDTDKIIWRYISSEDYTINESGDRLDLSYNTYSSSSKTWEMIVGDADQLAADNIRYRIETNITSSENWLIPTVYTQDGEGNRTRITVGDSRYYDYNRSDRHVSMTLSSKELGSERQVYVGMTINPDVFEVVNYEHFQIYEGNFATAEEAMAGTEITGQLFDVDMTLANAGYPVQRYTEEWITMVTFDGEGTVTGCLPLNLYCTYTDNYIFVSNLFERTEDGSRTYVPSWSVNSVHESYTWENLTHTLYKGYAADRVYYQTMTYYKVGSSSNSDVTAAFVGKYDSIHEAIDAEAEDVSDSLFSSDYDNAGYAADYSQGVYFTIFVGEDDAKDQEIYRVCVKAEEDTESSIIILGTGGGAFNSGTSLTFRSLRNVNGGLVSSYSVGNREDSYAEYNYRTMLVGTDVDLTNLTLDFTNATGSTVYVGDSDGAVEAISGQGSYDFSKGPIQFTVVAENGEDSANYWLQVVQATEGEGWIYINSMAAADAHTREENGIIYSDREVMLDRLHNNLHDIFLANMGKEAIPALSVELESDTVELDAYWTLSGNYDLNGFSTASTTTSYGELPNLAKIRLKAKEGATAGTDVSGTLTIKSGETVLIVLNLTGTVGNPSIITGSIPHAVKYVPYGSVVQNSNKYSWNKVSYELYSGTLPAGMEIKANGEIYGVPTEVGEFTFEVYMKNSYRSFSDDFKTYTLTVVENTDKNVDDATDLGYDLTERVQSVDLNELSDESKTVVSQGEYSEFVGIYLDGVKLVENVDYTSEPGSTRITIKTQTLASVDEGSHTLGIEFRTQDTDILKRAAQNYTVVKKNSDGGGSTGGNTGTESGGSTGGNTGTESGGSTGGNTGTNSGGSTGGNTGTNSGNASGTTKGSMKEDTTIRYTVASGDTLWKIAKKFYGSGSYWKKIFADNADIIKDANKIYAGQVIIIYLTTQDNSGEGVLGGNTYIVQRGDTLWKIAQQAYGLGYRWKKIYQANENVIADPSKIYAGQEIVIPEL